ncbi:MAG: class I SAM-dependent methyltransferase [Blastocatellia bacterium]|nr:class I SAM-dependent methyltransferase [Blastocatellia bacterium]MCS7156931.1 class I SAM-dependent methyltransferase [Blastocatellia bacterium]MDW8167623.1 class I SAM-dependent methyltransferase [Acidobacteriota bacterium]MDW8256223.1 class I SAM-dependent methyltransferase [Acidobacteriota bacterium]
MLAHEVSHRGSRWGSSSSSAIFRAWWIRFLEMADVRPGARVLDIAWETAGTALQLSRLVEPGGRVVCLSFTEAQMERLRAEARAFGLAAESKIEWRVATTHRLPFEDAQFDVVSCAAGVRHLNVPHLAREAHRVLAARGRFVLTERLLQGTPCDSLFLRLRRAFYRYIRRDSEEAEATFYTADRLAELLRAVGFAQIFVRGLERPRFQGWPVLSLVRAWKAS